MSYHLNMENARPLPQKPKQDPIDFEPEVPVQEPIDNQQVEAQEPEVEAHEEAIEPQEEVRPQAQNFRNLRAQLEQAQRERDEAIRFAQEANTKRLQEPEEDYDLNMAPDEIAEGKHLNKIEKKFKKLEEQQRYDREMSKQIAIETRIKSMYPDYEQVVNETTVSLLRESDPELAALIHNSSDLYSKAVTVYKEIKKMGLGKTYNREKEIVAKNLAKPRPASSANPQTGGTPLEQANAFANGLTAELKAQLIKEMANARKAI